MEKKIGEILLNYNIITKKQLQKALDKHNQTGKRLGQQLLDLGYITEKELVHVLEYQLGIPHVDLRKYDVNPALAIYIPENIARRYQAVPVAKENNKLRVAMADPSNIVAIDDMEITS